MRPAIAPGALALVRLAARRWPAAMRADMRAEWAAEIAALAAESGPGPITRGYRQLRFAVSLLRAGPDRALGGAGGWRPTGLLRHAPIRWLVRVGVPTLAAAFGVAFFDGWSSAVLLTLVSAVFVVAAIRRTTVSGYASPRRGTAASDVDLPVTAALRAVRSVGVVAAGAGGALWVWTLTGLTPQVERLGGETRDVAHLGVQEMREAAILIVVGGIVAITKGTWLPALPAGGLLLTADLLADRSAVAGPRAALGVGMFCAVLVVAAGLTWRPAQAANRGPLAIFAALAGCGAPAMGLYDFRAAQLSTLRVTSAVTAGLLGVLAVLFALAAGRRKVHAVTTAALGLLPIAFLAAEIDATRSPGLAGHARVLLFGGGMLALAGYVALLIAPTVWWRVLLAILVGGLASAPLLLVGVMLGYGLAPPLVHAAGYPMPEGGDDAIALFTAFMIIGIPLAAVVRWRVSAPRILPALTPPAGPPFDPSGAESRNAA